MERKVKKSERDVERVENREAEVLKAVGYLQAGDAIRVPRLFRRRRLASDRLSPCGSSAASLP
jgi:hypothetical protein